MPPTDNADKPGPERLDYSLDEAVFPWLSPLLDAYAITDRGVNEAVGREKKKGRELACGRGCSRTRWGTRFGDRPGFAAA